MHYEMPIQHMLQKSTKISTGVMMRLFECLFLVPLFGCK